MASSNLQFFIFSLLLVISSSKAQQPSPKPKSLLLPVTKDTSTLQYLTHLNIGTPLTPKSLVLDLGGRHLWMDCENGYNSSTYHPGHCGSAACSVAKPSIDCDICFSDIPKPGCTNYTCLITLENMITRTVCYCEVSLDTISIQSTVILKFIFGCSQTWLIAGLAAGAKGVAGLGRTQIGLPRQLSSKFGGSLPQKFALCLSQSNGVVLFGNGPYVFYPKYNKAKLIDVSKSLSFTKLYINPVPTADDVEGEPSAEYFVGVTSILVNRKPMKLNMTLLSIDKKGYGGTKISTVDPYTVLESSIYKAVAEAFAMELKAMNVAKVAPLVAPFTECFSTESLSNTLVGLGVPDIAFEFENKGVVWELHGANLVAEISRGMACLAFVDGGLNPRTSIVIGGHQLEDNLLQFDLAASKLGFTSTLLGQEVECSTFKF